MSNPTPVFVLVAEDDENDVFFLRRAFHEAGLTCPIVDVPNGKEAINYLSGRSTDGDRESHPLPALLILDLKMPLVDGFDLLTWLQNRPELHDLPTVVLSSSSLDLDVKRARELGARDYLVKPQAPDELVKLVQELSLHWLPRELPTSSAPF